MPSHLSNVGCKIKNSIEIYPDDRTYEQFLGPSCNMSIWLTKVTDQEMIDMVCLQ